MRAAVVGLVIVLSVVAIGSVSYPEASAQRPAAAPERAAGGGELIALSFDAGEGRQQITVVDPRGRTIAVYHVDRATGGLTLRSVRNIHWDLQIEDYNSASPTPREIRALSEQR